jgi:hypothetical protein
MFACQRDGCREDVVQLLKERCCTWDEVWRVLC